MKRFISTLVLWLVTWPYFWTLCHHTINPIRRISSCTTDLRKLWRAIEMFRRHKDEELRFVMTASTLSAAANLASLQWPTTPESPWAARALWYCSLLLAIFALILAAQQSVLLKLVLPPFSSTSRSYHYSDGCDDAKNNPKTSSKGSGSVSVQAGINEEEEILENTVLRLFVRRRHASNSPKPKRPPTSSEGPTSISTSSSTFEEATVIESQPPRSTMATTSRSSTTSASSPTTVSYTGNTRGRATTSRTSTLVGPGSPPLLLPRQIHSGIPDRNMMYIWQAPLMFMSWSWVSYTLGLTLWVVSPVLWPWIGYEDDEMVAILYTACCTVTCVNFGWCSAWAYRAAAPAAQGRPDESWEQSYDGDNDGNGLGALR